MIGRTISHYTILQMLGQGGMGIVYKAQDTKLGRLVALKFLSHNLVVSEQGRSRFIQEAKAAAALNHTNICTIYGIEEHDDDQFIVMEYVDGETLRNKIAGTIPQATTFPLPINDLIAYAVQIGDGLHEAHSKGIIHRDIKPENIMVNANNQIKIMDFGLAKFKDEMGLTKTATTLGTVAYMSPEQIRAEKVDHCTDIWSFGVMLYEMLTGLLPFRGKHQAAMVYSITNEEPQSISLLRTDIPQHLQAILTRPLEKDKARRYQSVHEMMSDVKRPVSTVSPLRQEKSIVVLPFENISPEKENEYFSDGLTEAIITDLSKIASLRVISRNSAMMLKGKRKPTKTIAEELNVQYVLEGSVRKAGNNLRIAAQLIDAKNDAHLWAEKYNGTVDDVFDIQEKVSRSIADALKLTLAPEEDQVLGRRTIPNAQAYECFLKAREQIRRLDKKSLEYTFQLTRNALDLVGPNDLLYASLGYANYFYFRYINILDESFLINAEHCVNKVFKLNPNSSHGHILRGLIHNIRGNLQEFSRSVRRAVSIDPSNADALGWLAASYYWAGKTEAAAPVVTAMLEIDPLTPSNHLARAGVQTMDGRFEAALEFVQRAHRMDPPNSFLQWQLASTYAWCGRNDEAYLMIDRLVESAPDWSVTEQMLFLKYGLQGDTQRALQFATKELEIQAKYDPHFSIHLAECFALAGEKQKALDLIEQAIRGFYPPHFFANDRLLDDIRGEERFKKLMEEVNKKSEAFEV